VHDLVETSADAGDIAQSDEIGEAMMSLRTFMFERVYQEQDHTHVEATVRRIFDDLLAQGHDLEGATDYLAGMTDRFALAYEVA
jgi:dGTPase